MGLVAALTHPSCYASQLPSLDKLALKYDTDKASNGHNYTPAYDKLFSPMRDQPVTLLEIGIYKGSSLLMWDAYFTHPQTRIYFIDIDKKQVDFWNGQRGKTISDRVQCFVADQSNVDNLNAVASTMGRTFDIIVDDGGHTMEQQITSFKTLFPFVSVGGVYIVEDLFTSYLKYFGGDEKKPAQLSGHETTAKFLCGLVNELNYLPIALGGCDNKKTGSWCSNRQRPGREKLPTYYQQHVNAVKFHSGTCFVFKD